VTSVDAAKKLHAAIRRLRAGDGSRAAAGTPPCPFAGADPLVHLFVESFLLWEATTPLAREALSRLCATVVDYNELRVCFTDELVAALGGKYPRGDERCARLRCALNDLFRREHAVTLAPLLAPSVKDARGYLGSLDGTPAYVAARVALLGLGQHAVPVDSRLVTLLSGSGCCEPTDPCEPVAAWLEKQFKPGEAPEAHALLQAWSDREGDGTPRKRRENPDGETKSKPARSAKPRGKARAKD